MVKFICDRCGKEEPNASNIRIVHHNGEQLELCADCGKKYSQLIQDAVDIKQYFIDKFFEEKNNESPKNK